MNEPNSLDKLTNHPSGFPSGDCLAIVLDGPGDTTVRPSEGKIREAGLREQKRIASWEEWLRENQPGTDPYVPLEVVLDGPGDTAVRPSEGKIREAGLREQKRIAFWETWMKENENNPNAEPPKDAPRHPLRQEPLP